MDDLIRVVQPAIIEEQWRTVKARWDAKLAEAESLVCTPETIQAVKQYRAEIRKEFEAAEDQRKAVKAAIFAPWNRAEETYKECVSEPFKATDSALKRKIDDFEAEIKQQCENGLLDYFAELCAVRDLDWLDYGRAGIVVDMASAKAKTPKRLREQLAEFVKRVGDSVDRIMLLEHSDEIMVEFKRSLDATDAICTVQERHRRIEAEREALDTRSDQKAIESEAVARVEALAPPTVQEELLTVTFTVTDTKERLIALREWMKKEGYKYE